MVSAMMNVILVIVDLMVEIAAEPIMLTLHIALSVYDAKINDK